jgi:streptogramin lyase
MRLWACIVILLAGGLPFLAGSAPAQDPSSAVVARFQSARALDVDPRGRLYVADAGADVVRIFEPKGSVRATLGGPGTRAGEFDAPTDVDATNGQALWVADAGNGRLQRFSEELQYLEALPVGRSLGTPEQRVFDDGRDGGDVQGQGRPVAVATSDTDDVFVVDERDDVVVAYDDKRRAERIVGDRSGLRGPVALAVDGTRRLYVADREQNAIFAYDLFGTFLERLPLPDLPSPRALTLHRGRLWVVCADRIVVWDPARRTRDVHPVDVAVPLVDAARRADTVFLLTERRLLRRSGWGEGRDE